MNRLFVYGSLLSAHNGSSLRRLLGRPPKSKGGAHVPGRLYRITDYPGFVARAAGLDRVHGEVLVLSRPRRDMAILDHYEECGPLFSRPWEYRRRRITAYRPGLAPVRCWIYEYQRSPQRHQRIIGGDWRLA